MSTMEAPRSRVYYLDYLRAFVVLVVIIHHSLLPYVAGFDWSINDTAKAFPYSAASAINDVFMMPTMFFIAGYFAFPSIRNGVKAFIVNKLIRIAVPFFLGITFLTPVISYLELAHRKAIDVTYATYWLKIHFRNYINPHHLWFLSSLFLFFLVFALIYSLMKDKLEAAYLKSKTNPPSANSILIFTAAMLGVSILLFYSAGRVFPDGTWSVPVMLVPFQVTRWTGYVLYFTAGILAYIKRVTVTKRLMSLTPFLILAVMLFTWVFLEFKYKVYYTSNRGFSRPDIQFYNAVIHVIYCFLIFITLATLFKRIDRPMRIPLRFAANSYTAYLVHMVYSTIIQYYIVSVPIGIFSKFLITAAGTVILSIATSEVIACIRSFSRTRGFYLRL